MRRRYDVTYLRRFRIYTHGNASEGHGIGFDEVGWLPLKQHDATFLFEVVSKRYETGRPIILSFESGFVPVHLSKTNSVLTRDPTERQTDWTPS